MAQADIKIEEQKCIKCGACKPYCSRDAIVISADKKNVIINSDLCIECGHCAAVHRNGRSGDHDPRGQHPDPRQCTGHQDRGRGGALCCGEHERKHLYAFPSRRGVCAV